MASCTVKIRPKGVEVVAPNGQPSQLFAELKGIHLPSMKRATGIANLQDNAEGRAVVFHNKLDKLGKGRLKNSQVRDANGELQLLYQKPGDPYTFTNERSRVPAVIDFVKPSDGQIVRGKNGAIKEVHLNNPENAISVVNQTAKRGRFVMHSFGVLTNIDGKLHPKYMPIQQAHALVNRMNRDSDFLFEVLDLGNGKGVIREVDSVKRDPTLDTLIGNLTEKFGISATWVSKEEARSITMNNGSKLIPAGFFFKGKVYLVEGVATKDTALHEFMHPFVDSLYHNNKALFDNLHDEIMLSQDGQRIYKEVKASGYMDMPNFGPVSLSKEIMTRALEEMAAEKLTNPEPARNLWQKILDMLGRVFGVKDLDPNMTLEEVTMSILQAEKVELGTVPETSDRNIIQAAAAEQENMPVSIDQMRSDPKGEAIYQTYQKIKENQKRAYWGGQKGIYPEALLDETMNKLMIAQYMSDLREDQTGYDIKMKNGEVKTMKRMTEWMTSLEGPFSTPEYLKFGTKRSEIERADDEGGKDAVDNQKSLDWGNIFDDLLEVAFAHPNKEWDDPGVQAEINERLQEYYAKKSSGQGQVDEGVMQKMYEVFQEKRQMLQDMYGNVIVVPQQKVFNLATGVAGVADITIVREDGKVITHDLKTSLKPTVRKYKVKLADGREVWNSYETAFSTRNERRASKAERHGGQLSGYDAIFNAMGIRTVPNELRTWNVHLENASTDENLVIDAKFEQMYEHGKLGFVHEKVRNDPFWAAESAFEASMHEDVRKVLDKLESRLNEISRLPSHTNQERKEMEQLIFSIHAVIDYGFIQKISKHIDNFLMDVAGVMYDSDKGIRREMTPADWTKLESLGIVEGESIRMLRAQSKLAGPGNPKMNIQLLNKLHAIKKQINAYQPALENLVDMYNKNLYSSQNQDIPIVHNTEGLDRPMISHITQQLEILNNTERRIKGIEVDMQLDVIWANIDPDRANTKLSEAVERDQKTLAHLKEQLAKFKAEGNDKRVRQIENRIVIAKASLRNLNEQSATRENIKDLLMHGSYQDVSYLSSMLLSVGDMPGPLTGALSNAMFDAANVAQMQIITSSRQLLNAMNDLITTDGGSMDRPVELTRFMRKKRRRLAYTEDLPTLDENGEPVWQTDPEGNETFEWYYTQEVDYEAYDVARAKAWHQIERDIAHLKGAEIREKRAEMRNAWYKENRESIPREDTVDPITKKTIVLGSKNLRQTMFEKLTPQQFEAWKSYHYKEGQTISEKSDILTRPKLSKYADKDFKNMSTGQRKFYNTAMAIQHDAMRRYPPDVWKPFKVPEIRANPMEKLERSGVKASVKEKVDDIFNLSKEHHQETYGETTIDAVPIMYNGHGMNPDDVSQDALASIAKYANGAYVYEMRSSMEGFAISVRDRMLKHKPYKTKGKGIITESGSKAIFNKVRRAIQRKNKETDETVDESALDDQEVAMEKETSNIAAAVASWIEDVIYGRGKVEAVVGGMDLNAIVGFITSVGSHTQIGGDLLLAVANYFQGQTQSAIESWAGQYYGTRDWARAGAIYAKHLPGMMNDAFEHPLNGKDIVSQMILFIDPMQEQYSSAGHLNAGSFFRRNAGFSTPWFAAMSAGDHAMKIQSMIAMMHKLRNEHNGGDGTMSLFDAYELGEDGRIRLKEGVDLAQFSESGEIESSDMEGVESLPMPKGFKRRVHKVNRELHGNYSRFNRPQIMRHWFGDLLMQYRRFFPSQMHKRTGREAYNYEADEMSVGSYVTIWKRAKDLIDEKRGIIAERPALLDHERAAINRFFAEMAMFFTFVMLAAAMKKLVESAGDDDRKLLYIPLYLLDRNMRESRAFFHPEQFLYILRSPFAATSIINKTMSLFTNLMPGFTEEGGFGWATYERDTALASKGDFKFKADILKLVGTNPRKWGDVVEAYSLQSGGM